MTAQRIIVSGATTAVTRRCNLRKSFLAPWDPRVTKIRLYAMALAQRRTGVAIHHSIDVVTHYHTEVTPRTDNLPEFVRIVNNLSSRALNRLLALERYDVPANVFDGREPHYLRLMDPEAQAGHLVYSAVNCVAAGLVDRPRQMPGYVFDFGLWKAGGVWVERPEVFFSAKLPQRMWLEVVAPPLLYWAFGGDVDALVHHMRRLVDHAVRRIRAARACPVLGARRVRRIHPWSEPNTPREDRRSDGRTFKFGARDLLGRREHVAAAREVAGFRQRYVQARRASLAGDSEALYPFGTYGPRVRSNALVELDPPEGARVTMPGPTLEDVVEQLERGPGAGKDGVHAVLDEVRETISDEACALVDEDPMNLEHAPGARSTESSRAGEALDRVHVRRSHERHPKPAPGEARRVVTLRDRRRGRRVSGNHGSDPPR